MAGGEHEQDGRGPSVEPPKNVYQGARSADIHETTDESELTPNLAKRCLVVALLTFALLSLPLLAMYDRRLPSDKFYVQKLVAKPKFDVVFVGDSRCLHGIDPSRIVGLRSYNFSFRGMGLQDESLDHAKKLIDPDSPFKAIVLTVSRPNLSDQHQDANEYQTFSQTTPLEMRNLLLFGGVSKYLRLNPDPRAIGGRKGKVLERPGGFAATVGIKNEESATRGDAKSAKDPSAQVSDEVLAHLAIWIRSASAEGYKVFALRIPTSQQMFELESTRLGFDEAKIRSVLESAGASWIDTPPYRGDLHSYDGSHLDAASADLFSDELSVALSRALKS